MTAASRAAAFGAILAALCAAHDLADHVAQTDHQAKHKATSWPAMAGHVGSYTAVQVAALAVLRPMGVQPSWRRMVAGVAVSAGTHAFLDRRWPVAAILRYTRSPKFAVMDYPISGPYLADQSLHHACLFVTALILAGSS
jgi:Protein of unknown function (DUF3307)